MRVLIFGKGGISDAIAGAEFGFEVVELSKHQCDVASFVDVGAAVRREDPDWIINCAGVSDKRAPDPQQVFDTNLFGTLNVIRAGINSGKPVIAIGSVAGLYGRGPSPWYAASKAGVISLVQSYGNQGFPVYCISPGRVNTSMREFDHPGEDTATRLRPYEIAIAVKEIMDGLFSPGANVVVRKVGTDRVDWFEDMPPWKSAPSLL